MVAAVETMAYAGETPWHGLGVEISPDLTPQEIAVEAGIDWKVEKRDVFYKNQKGNLVRAAKKQALVRSTDERYMDIVSDDWIPVQNQDAVEFFDAYVKAGGIKMHTAGSLKDGKIIWALAKIDDGFSLFGGKDRVDSYLLLSNPHQFGHGVDIRFTPIRVVCNNTLSMALSGKATLGISLNHRSEFNPARAQLALAEAHEKMNQYKEMSQFLSTKKFTQDKVFEYFINVFPKTTASNVISFEKMMKERAAGKKVVSRNAEAAMEYLENQPGQNLGKGTWWHAYNTVTYMTNHVLGQQQDTRIQSAWYGANKDRNINALGLAIEYAEAA